MRHVLITVAAGLVLAGATVAGAQTRLQPSGEQPASQGSAAPNCGTPEGKAAAVQLGHTGAQSYAPAVRIAGVDEVIARSAATKQSREASTSVRPLDCFASLAMTPPY